MRKKNVLYLFRLVFVAIGLVVVEKIFLFISSIWGFSIKVKRVKDTLSEVYLVSKYEERENNQICVFLS